MTLGQLISMERKELKISQEELAYRVQRSQDWLSLIERDKQEPTIDDVENLARELKSKLLRNIADGRTFSEFKRRFQF